jgi:hypothetical protein
MNSRCSLAQLSISIPENRLKEIVNEPSSTPLVLAIKLDEIIDNHLLPQRVFTLGKDKSKKNEMATESTYICLRVDAYRKLLQDFTAIVLNYAGNCIKEAISP